MWMTDLFEAMSDDAEHFDALRKTGFFGARGAGCIFLAKSTGRILLCHRSEYVEQPGTWGNWGGAINSGEDPLEAVHREAHEETGNGGPFEFIPLYIFRKDTFQYFNFLCVVEEEFEPALDWESQGFAWCEFGEWPQPLHFGLISLFNDPESVRKIKAEIVEARQAQGEVDEGVVLSKHEMRRFANDGVFRGCWTDEPGMRGFKDRPGVYLVRRGSNAAYGNYNGGFKDEREAEEYRRRNAPKFEVKKNP